MGNARLRAVGWARSLPLSADVKTARDWARGHLQTLDWAARDEETVDAVLLAVSELVTNAQVHARSSAQLVLAWDHQCLHVAVHDASPQLPRARAASVDSLGGRGMLLVDALAESWEVRPCPYGKTVVACFRPPAASAATLAPAGGADGPDGPDDAPDR